MKVVHLTPHLGGGVGKAHMAVQSVTSPEIHRTYCLLEEPRDRRYADAIADAGAAVVIPSDRSALERLVEDADVVQIEWWNHPRVYELLARSLPPMRSLFWAHVSGLFPPLIPAGLIERAGRFLFTSPCSLQADSLGVLSDSANARIGVAGSGFGFEPPQAPVPSAERSAIAYLGTVDFVKMHPEFFSIIDTVGRDIRVDIWGGFDSDGAPARAARAMRHPERVAFRGQTSDPQSVLERVAIFFYPLRPDHYGTAENALIEAMSLGAVPLVLANPAECAIVKDGANGCVAADAIEAVGKLERMLADPAALARMSQAAMADAAADYRPERTAEILEANCRALMSEPKAVADFTGAIGTTPRDWFLSTQFADGRVPQDVSFELGGILAKGSLDHFLAAFPGDAGLMSLCAPIPPMPSHR